MTENHENANYFANIVPIYKGYNRLVYTGAFAVDYTGALYDCGHIRVKFCRLHLVCIQMSSNTTT